MQKSLELDTFSFVDAFALLESLPDESIDLVFTDPPYAQTNCAWDKKIDVQRLMRQLIRVAKPHAAILIWSKMPFAAELVQACKKYYRYQWVIEKKNATGFLNARRRPMSAHELIQVFYKKPPVYHFQKEAGSKYMRPTRGNSNVYKYYKPTGYYWMEGRFPRDVIKFSWREEGIDLIHSTQKPLEAIKYFIKTYSEEENIILDPFAGSGVVGVAAKALNRHYILGENNLEIYTKGRRWLEGNATEEDEEDLIPF